MNRTLLKDPTRRWGAILIVTLKACVAFLRPNLYSVIPRFLTVQLW